MTELKYNRRANALLDSFAQSGHMPHALLIEGPAGAGKKTFAALAARLSLCTDKIKPCTKCSGCIKVEKGIHPDVRFYTVPDGKKEFPIDLVRAIRQDAYISPNEGNFKVYIIDKAHTMNTAAQNALLKIIEEPPPHVRFILLCENRSLMLPTILSRVTSVELETPTPEQCEIMLETLSPNSDITARRAAAIGASGNIGRALSLLACAKPSKAAVDVEKLKEALIFGGRYEALRILASYDKDRESLIQLMALLEQAFGQLACAPWRANNTTEEKRYMNRVTSTQALCVAQGVHRAAERAQRNVSVALLTSCMTEEAKEALE